MTLHYRVNPLLQTNLQNRNLCLCKAFRKYLLPNVNRLTRQSAAILQDLVVAKGSVADFVMKNRKRDIRSRITTGQ